MDVTLETSEVTASSADDLTDTVNGEKQWRPRIGSSLTLRFETSETPTSLYLKPQPAGGQGVEPNIFKGVDFTVRVKTKKSPSSPKGQTPQNGKTTSAPSETTAASETSPKGEIVMVRSTLENSNIKFPRCPTTLLCHLL